MNGYGNRSDGGEGAKTREFSRKTLTFRDSLTIMNYVIEKQIVRGDEGDSKVLSKGAANRRRWKTGASRGTLKITPELRAEKRCVCPALSK